VKFVYPAGNPSRKPGRCFPVMRFNWEGSDPDGTENLSGYELCWNDTASAGIFIDAAFSTAMIEAVNPGATMSDCRIYQGNSLTLHASLLQGLVLNDTNVLYIRSVDKVGEKSFFAASYSIFVRKPTSATLLVNAYSSSIQAREDFYSSNLLLAGISSFDITRVNEVVNGEYTEHAPDNITQARIFSLFDVIIWFGKDAAYTLSLAEKTTDEFFNKGGRMFMAVEISSSMDPRAGYLGFTPIDSLVEPPSGSQFLLEKDSFAVPALTGWPVLKSTIFINPTRPFYESAGTTPLYQARISKTNPKILWTGKSTIMARKQQAGKTMFIISSIELHNLNGNNNMTDLFIQLFKNELEL
jgi:hypothetical protein